MAMAGLDELAGLRRGLGRNGLPIPAYRTLGAGFRSATAGAAVFRLPVSAPLTGPGGDLLPGAFAVVADACCGSAVASVMPAGQAALTAQLRVEFIRPVPPGQPWIEGRAEADAVDGDGGLGRGEIVDQADQLLGVASLRLMSASHPRSQAATARAVAARDTAVRAAAMPATSQLPVPETVAAAPAPAAAAAGDPPSRGAWPPPGAERRSAAPGGRPAGSAEFLGVVSQLAVAGRAAWTLRPSAGTANSFGMVHGGVLGLLAHQVASDAQQSLIGPGEQLIPLDLVVNFYRGVPAAGRLITAAAQVAHRGRRFVVAEGTVTGPDGKPALRLSAGAQVRAAP
jgi:uncharacterized protein (TIGR00369 family)